MTFLVDVNLLLYTAFDSYSEHAVCSAWLEGMLNDSSHLIGFPIAALLGFVRICTRSRSGYSPKTMEEAFELVERWMEPPNAYVPHPAKDRIHRVASLLKSVNGNHGLVADAHLARKNHAKAGAKSSLRARKLLNRRWRACSRAGLKKRIQTNCF
jgi:predicted nucleic acid-binding protein